ncbi:MAG: EpsG family protein [Spirochaetia bacterium]|nr:EpsG family protein [Spirochaetia bacterium]
MTGKKNQEFAFLFFVLFAILYIFRARVGTDYTAYTYYYDLMNSTQDLTIGGFELFYNLLALFFHTSHLPYQFMSICISTIIICVFYKTVKKINLELGITSLLALYFIFYPTIEILRQGIAVILFFYSLSYIIYENSNTKKDTFNYFLINLIGFLFHRTALIAFIFYFFKKNRCFKILILLFFICYGFAQPLINGILQRFPQFYSRYQYYIMTKNLSQNKTSLFSIKLIEYFISFIILLYIYINNIIKNQKGKKLINANLKYLFKLKNLSNKTKCIPNINTIDMTALNLIELGLLIQLFISPILGASYRLLYYCDLGIMLFYATIFYRINNKTVKVFYIIFLIIYLCLRFSRVFPFQNEMFIYHFLY